MAAFDPEITAASQLPADLLQRSQGLMLCMHLHPTGVSAAVFDPEEGNFLWISHNAVEQLHTGAFGDTVQFIGQKNWSSRIFRSTTITFDAPEFTLAPSAFVVPGQEHTLLPGASGGHISTYSLAGAGVSVIYEVPAAFDLLERSFPGARIHPAVGFELQYILGQRQRDKDSFHAIVEDGYLVIIALHKGEMKLTNHFGVQQEEDVLYHVANAAIRLGIDLEFSTVTVYGAGASPSLVSLLRTYARDVERWKEPAGFRIPSGADACSAFPLIIHPVCV